MNLPKDPVILLSYINTQLRDHFASFDELCLGLSIDAQSIQTKLADIDYRYDDTTNQFI